MLKKLHQNKKGFTLAELLIVVAIIGVLVAISIPIFTSQLEKAREATDAANIRSAYAELSAAALTGDAIAEDKTEGNITIKKADANAKEYKATIKLTQKTDGWQTDNLKNGTIGGMATTDTPKVDGTATVTINTENGTATLTY